MQKMFLTIGVVSVAISLLWPWLGKIPIGRLPGDIFINKLGVKVFIPITSMIIISVVISLLMWLLRK